MLFFPIGVTKNDKTTEVLKSCRLLLRKDCAMTCLLLLVLVSCLADALGPLPDARQEGILHPFGSYKDVALFHFHVPSQADRATWEFAGMMNNPCKSTK